jgi:hypothetical protein
MRCLRSAGLKGLEVFDFKAPEIFISGVNGIWRPLRFATEWDENVVDSRDITSKPRAIEAGYGLAMRGCASMWPGTR